MILDSEIWKNDLKKETKKIKKFFAKWDFEEDDSIDKPFITLQKFSIYTSVVIRKLIDVRKISDELLSENFSIENYKKTDSTKVTKWNGYEIEKLYDLELPLKRNISIKKLTDYLIHSFHFMPKYDWKKFDPEIENEDAENWYNNGILGIYFSSDKTKNESLYFIKFNDYLNIIEKVISDHIIQIQYIEGEIVKASNKSKASS